MWPRNLIRFAFRVIRHRVLNQLHLLRGVILAEWSPDTTGGDYRSLERCPALIENPFTGQEVGTRKLGHVQLNNQWINQGSEGKASWNLPPFNANPDERDDEDKEQTDTWKSTHQQGNDLSRRQFNGMFCGERFRWKLREYSQITLMTAIAPEHETSRKALKVSTEHLASGDSGHKRNREEWVASKAKGSTRSCSDGSKLAGAEVESLGAFYIVLTPTCGSFICSGIVKCEINMIYVITATATASFSGYFIFRGGGRWKGMGKKLQFTEDLMKL